MRKTMKLMTVMCAFVMACAVSAANIANYLPADSQLAFYFSMPAVAASKVLAANGVDVSECLAKESLKNPDINESWLSAEIAAGGVWTEKNDPSSGKGIIVITGSKELIDGCCAKAAADENCTAVTFAGYEGYNVNNPELAAKNISAVGIKIDANTILLAINMDEAAVAACAAGKNSNILTEVGTTGNFLSMAAENSLFEEQPMGKLLAKVSEADNHINFSAVCDFFDDAEAADKAEVDFKQALGAAVGSAAGCGIVDFEEIFANIQLDRNGNVLELNIFKAEEIVKGLIPVFEAFKEQNACMNAEICEMDDAEL